MSIFSASKMSAGMARSGFKWRSHLLIAISAPVISLPFLPPVKAATTHVHPRELDIYGEPEPLLQHQPEEEILVTPVEEKVSVARRSVWGWVKNTKAGVTKITTTLSSLEDKTLEFAELIRTDQTFQIKVGGITAGFVAGALLAGRGRRPVRRIFLSLALGTAAAAICYPKKAVDITLTNYKGLKEFVKEWRGKLTEEKTSLDQKTNQMVAEENESVQQLPEITQAPSAEEDLLKEDVPQETTITNTDTEREVPAANEEPPSFWDKIPFVKKLFGGKSEPVDKVTPISADSTINDTPVDAKSATMEIPKDEVIIQEDSQSKRSKVEGDRGQSNPEDKDMYTTRS